MATADPRFLPRNPNIADSRHDLMWSTSMSPAEFVEALAAAKREGAREAVERIRGAVTVIRYPTRKMVIAILDEEAAR
jgi:hypothetical protein